ncbi:alpha/beta hydrolase [Pseudalkalibacillus hwajinpoensis]|uniref:Alpha/beta hydrolase n=1 Tax=Guptibacillus hwajinpoensis TaxID=208199 RepID=A0A4U1MMX9_9BACL|nr:alpha/beta hydrolase [Pseudalkalibacillus hwajinpoensis]TKD72066.1 alpha/beta hydrolase [Pseudalkalibacillus hwajinpoensis]
MPVYESIQWLLHSQQNKPPLYNLALDEARKKFNDSASIMAGRGEPVAKVVDRIIHLEKNKLNVRCYYPATDTQDETLPAFVFYHGGGFVYGNLETHDVFCRLLSNRSKCVVISVDYRLAPEHKFPKATEDAYQAFLWTHEHAEELGINHTRIAVGGDSAGGNLAAVTAIKALEQGGPSIAYQLLIYPVVDSAKTYPSYKENSDGYFLTALEMEWFHKQYVDETIDPFDPHLSPLHSNHLGNLPPTHIVTALYDPLRDEGEAYAEQISQAGGTVTVKRYDRMVHGFISMTGIVPEAYAAVEELGEELRRVLYEGSVVK